MPRKKVKEPAVKLGSYKQISNSAFRYIQRAQQSKRFDTETLQRAHAITSYFNKDGTLSKRKTRTSAQREEFNELISSAKTDRPFTKTKAEISEERKRKRAENRKPINEAYLNKAGSKKSAWASFDVFKSNPLGDLIDSNSYYDIVLESTSEEGTTSEDIIEILQRIHDRFTLATPSYSTSKQPDDERFRFLDSVMQEVDKLRENPERNDSQLKKIIADALKSYNQSDVVKKNAQALSSKVRAKRRERTRHKK